MKEGEKGMEQGERGRERKKGGGREIEMTYVSSSVMTGCLVV